MYIVDIYNNGTATTIHGEKEKVSTGSMVHGLNAIDSLSLSLLPSNVGFNQLHEKKTLVTVYNSNKKREEFYGRVLTSNPSMSENGAIKKAIVCESCFGFLCDSEQEYVEEQNWTVNGLFSFIIDCHNSQVEEYKRFTIGEVTVTDPNDNLYLGIQRKNTWDTLKEKLVDKLGGEFRYRRVEDVLYIDYLTEIGETKATKIALSHNMKSVSQEKDPSAYITRLVPLGCKLTKEVTTTDSEGNTVTETVETEQRLDISSVNNGVKYIIDEQAEAAYGINQKSVEWDGVTEPGILKTKGENYLIANNKVKVKYTATAIDLSLLGLDIDDYQLGNRHPLENHLLGIDDTVRIIKKNTNICEETKSTIDFGDSFKTLSEIQREQAGKLEQTIQNTKEELKNFVSSQTTKLEQRIEGIDGLFFYIKYSQYADGHVMTDAPNASTLYMGTCSTNAAKAPTDYREYTWCLVRGADGEDGADGKDGADGTAGAPGKDGVSQYLHIKYSDDGKTFTANNGETLGAWIGTLVDFTEADSTTFSDYTWKKFTEDVDEELEEIRTSIVEQRTEVINDCTAIIMSALEDYVETSNYEEYKRTVSSQLEIMADEITMNFTTTTEQITNVDGDLQTKFSKLYKYLQFSGETALTIGSGDSMITLELDNEQGIVFRRNGIQFGLWDGENFYTGNIIIRVNERAQFGNFAFVPRSDESLSFLKVSG